MGNFRKNGRHSARLRRTVAISFLPVLGLVIASPVGASVASEMNGFFSDLGGGANVNGPAAYQGQMAGYYTGGSLYVRAPQKNITPISISLPKVSAGCGGIDIFTGGFSFVNSDQIIATMKAIANNAVGFAFKLAIDAISQQIGKVMGDLQAIADDINGKNINSCELARGLVGSSAAALTGNKSYVCKTLANDKGIFSDFAKARAECDNEGKATQVATANADPNKEGESSVVARNYTWWAIYKGKASGSAPSKEFGEFLMTLLGTVVYRPDGGDDGEGFTRAVSPDLAPLKTMLDGSGSAGTKLLECDSTDPDQCLDPTQRDWAVGEAALKPKIQDLIQSMRDKVLTDTALSADEIALLGLTSIPLYKIITVSATAHAGLSAAESSELAEIVAVDVALTMVQTMIQDVKRDMREQNAPASRAFESWVKNLNSTSQEIANLRTTVEQRFQVTAEIVNRTQLLERQLRGNLAPQLTGALGFSRSQSKGSAQ